MSYRELRNFTEMMQALGYPRLISIENFRQPNFRLVAEVLAWLIKKYDNDYDVPLETETEQDRVIFIKSAAQIMIQRARIKLNPKKLYQADGYAVQELLKIAGVLYGALQENRNGAPDDEDQFNVTNMTTNVQNRLNELRTSRQLASEITERGASLYDLLNKEPELREMRSLALARNLEISDVEKSIKTSIRSVEQEIKEIMVNLDNVASDEANLDAKIEKKRMDLERQQKRLGQLQAVRPAYMDEYEKLERELQQLYNLYVQTSRNVAYLESLQNESDRAEQERVMEAEMSLRKMAEKMREEERQRQVATEKLESANAGPEFSDDENNKASKGPKVYGNMLGGAASEDEEEDESMLSDDDDDDEIETGNVPQKGRPPQAAKQGRPAPKGDLGEFSDADDEDVREPPPRRSGGVPKSEPVDEHSDDDF